MRRTSAEESRLRQLGLAWLPPANPGHVRTNRCLGLSSASPRPRFRATEIHCSRTSIPTTSRLTGSGTTDAFRANYFTRTFCAIPGQPPTNLGGALLPWTGPNQPTQITNGPHPTTGFASIPRNFNDHKAFVVLASGHDFGGMLRFHAPWPWVPFRSESGLSPVGAANIGAVRVLGRPENLVW